MATICHLRMAKLSKIVAKQKTAGLLRRLLQ
jgi:hypothetical protein